MSLSALRVTTQRNFALLLAYARVGERVRAGVGARVGARVRTGASVRTVGAGVGALVDGLQ